jgi:hypothetical protein
MVVISESREMNLLWGFLAVVFSLALFRLVTSNTAGTTRLALVVLLVALLFGTVGTWIWSLRNPARLEITSETIQLRYGDRPNAVTLYRRDGDLYVSRAGGRYPQRYLRVTGSDAAIPLMLFDWSAVAKACREAGWQFAGNEVAESPGPGVPSDGRRL